MTLETLAKDIAASAEAQAKAMIKEAKAEAKTIVGEAEAKATSIRDEAQSRAEREAGNKSRKRWLRALGRETRRNCSSLRVASLTPLTMQQSLNLLTQE
jgi:vacuolar-type H+-ATPase subunit E/Vma4